MESPDTIEQVVLPIRRGAEADFETAFPEARKFIERAPGFRWLRLAKGVEHSNHDLSDSLDVCWQRQRI